VPKWLLGAWVNNVNLNPEHVQYSQHPKTGPSGIQMVIFRTKFWSGFQMVGHLVLAAILLKPFENRTKKSGFRMVKTSLDCFIQKKIFLYVQNGLG
jgi:hypothetical protein